MKKSRALIAIEAEVHRVEKDLGAAEAEFETMKYKLELMRKTHEGLLRLQSAATGGTNKVLAVKGGAK